MKTAPSPVLKLLPYLGKMIPGMGNKHEKTLCGGLFSKTRQVVLSLLYGRADESFYTKQILDAVKVGRGTVQRELKNLTEAGIITREVQGRQVYYRANKKCPIFNELRSTIRKTFGLADVIRQSLAPVSGKIEVSFIFGSMASGTEGRASDIDLMVVGEVTFSEIVSLINPAQVNLGREINPVVYPVAEFKHKIAENHSFVETVLGSEKIFIFGDGDELARLAGEGHVQNA